MNRTLASCCVAAFALLALDRPATAATALVGAAQPTELRVAFAQTPDFTTVWTSVHIDDAPGPFAIVLPLPDGAFVDQSSDAWFEALEVATAPRVFPPEGLSPHCPGDSGPAHPFEIAGDVTHQTSLSPDTLTLADDAGAVAAWASEQGLTLSADLQSALAAIPAARFLCVRFTGPGGPALTPTLRVTAPGAPPALPFSITRAGATDVRVSAWFLGAGRGSLDGTTSATLSPSAVVWNAKQQTSTYASARDEALAAQPDSAFLESAGHDALADALPIANGTATIDALAPTYFARAAEYGNGASDHVSCTAAAKATLASAEPVGPACPRGDLAALAGDCTPEAPGAGEIDPATLLCGPGADDLAVALSGAVPGDTFLTRRTFLIAAGAPGKDRTVSFPAGASKQPLVEASSVDVSDCYGGSGGSGGTTSTTGGSGNGSGASGASGSGASGAGGAPSGSGNGGYVAVGVDLDPDIPYIVASGCSCGGPGDSGTLDTSETETGETETGETETETSSDGGDDCSGDSSSSSSSSSGGDDCSGDSSGSSSSGGDDCSGDSGSSSSGDGCSSDSGSSGDGCSSDSGGSSSDDGSSDDGASGDGASGDFAAQSAGSISRSISSSACAVTASRPAARRTAAVRLSPLTLGLAVVLLPLRRRGTRKRRGA